jgi:hypothetical protein
MINKFRDRFNNTMENASLEEMKGSDVGETE